MYVFSRQPAAVVIVCVDKPFEISQRRSRKDKFKFVFLTVPLRKDIATQPNIHRGVSLADPASLKHHNACRSQSL